ncbi:meckelin isoform X2 [Bacillus rossius redtenbacheri]|uniref:meckelin isoform X2 n=1 Tax=Bacillus rossius redtenbacheri TaxID=93214 RepID=UPI002FDCA18B
MMKLLLLFCILLYQFANIYCSDLQLYSNVNDCAWNQYFNSRLLKCLQCDSSKNLQPTDDKLSCTCNGRSKMVEQTTDVPRCEPCPKGQVPTLDKRDCISCRHFHLLTNLTLCKPCSLQEAAVERHENGSVRDYRTCVACGPGSRPSEDGRSCLPCAAGVFSTPGNNCSCPSYSHETIDGVCVARTLLADWPDNKSTYSVETLSGRKVESSFLRKNLRLAVYSCKLRNEKACQAVANMCAMVLYRDDHKTSPCRLFRDARHIPTSDGGPLPWLFYGEGDAPTVLARKRIVTRYSLNYQSQSRRLNLTVASYDPDGRFAGLRALRGGPLQLCPGSWLAGGEGALRFGVPSRRSCTLPASRLLAAGDARLHDLYLQYWDGTDSFLHALPVLPLDLVSQGRHVNRASDQSQWQLVRRFFLVDALLAAKPDDSSPALVRYVKNMQLRVRVRGSDGEGRIYPPLVVVEYGELTPEDLRANRPVTLTFSTDYHMDNNFFYAVEVSVGVLSALAVLWACLEAWSASRRSGHHTIDLLSLGHVALFSCGHLASAFFCVVACACLHGFIFYKGQSSAHLLLPDAVQERLVASYVVSAFVLKAVAVAHLVWRQVTVDIFLLDWERPRAGGSVSVWRTCLVANEWNEIQTSRRVSPALQLLCTVFLLEVVGLKFWATPDPELHLSPPAHVQQNMPTLSVTCRFAVGILVYLFVYILQWLFAVGIYERYIKNELYSFVDICSMANISVFIMAWENYGFYIHGRSPHGFADTDLQTVLRQLRREEEDLCGHRGLLPGSDHQTFEMALPARLRQLYSQAVSPLTQMSQVSKRLSLTAAGGQRARMASSDLDIAVQTYRSVNKFLTAYLEHALKDIDYEVTEKTFMESLMDIEFTENAGKGMFYIDNGHSFGKVIFYGNEFTLATFELILFSFVDIMFQNFLLAAIVVAVVGKTVALVRKVCGKKNLAKKTLIDERFLV